MAKTTTRKKGISQSQCEKIWSTIPADKWLEIAQTHRKNHLFTRTAEGRITGLCVTPGHNERTPSFNVYFDKHFFKCYGCGHYSTDPIELASLLLDMSPPEAIGFLHDKFQLSFLSKKVIGEVGAQRKHQAMKQALFGLFHDILIQAVSDPASYAFAQDALNWLNKERQIPLDTLHALPIGITAPSTLIAEMLLERFDKAETYHKKGMPKPLDHTKKALDYIDDYLRSPEYVGAIVWPLHVSPTDIGRMKLRVPDNTKQFLIPEDEYEECLGLFGLGWEPYKDLIDPKKLQQSGKKTVSAFLTEGEMDVMSYMAKLVEQGKDPQFPLYSVGGTGGAPFIETLLRPINVDTAYLVGDAPTKGSAGGDPVIVSWLERLERIQAKIFTRWDLFDPCGDLDEVVHKLGEDKVTEVIWDNKKDNFSNAPAWVVKRTVDALSGIDEEDTRKLTETAAVVGKALKNRHEIQRFVDELSELFPNINSINLRREITAQSDNEAGFIESCTSALEDHLFGVGTEVKSSNRQIIFQHRTSKRIHAIRLDSEQAIAQELAPITGKLVNFVDSYVGFPHFLENPLTSDALVYRKTDQQLRFYMKEAVQDMAKGLPDFSTSMSLRQGYHYVSRIDPQPDLEYVVCGRDVFAIERVDGTIDYRQLEGPSDKGIIFDIGFKNNRDSEPWYPGGLTAATLREAKNVDLAETYNTLVHFFDTGFKFRNHTVTKHLLAALTLAFPIMASFPRQLLMFITGDTHSGKTNLLSVFSGLGSPKIRLLLCSQGMEFYTPAGVRNATKSDTRLLTLDEFEFTDPSRQHAVEEIMNWVRGLVNNQAVSAKSTAEGETEISTHKLPIIFSAISGAEKPQDLNRLLIVEMDKVEGKNVPTNVLVEEFGIDGLRELSRNVSLAMYAHVPEIRKCYDEIESAFPKLQDLVSVPVEYRYASSLFGALAVMKHIGRDWEAFFQEYVAQNSDVIHRATTITESEIYLNALLRNPVIYEPETKSVTSIAQLLANESKREQVNTSSTGVYFDESQELLLIMLDQAVARLLPPNYRQKNLTVTSLKDSLGRHRQALNAGEVRNSGILTKVTPFLGANVQEEHVVVLRAKPWLVSYKEYVESQKIQPVDAEEKEEQQEDPAANKFGKL